MPRVGVEPTNLVVVNFKITPSTEQSSYRPFFYTYFSTPFFEFEHVSEKMGNGFDHVSPLKVRSRKDGEY